MIEAVCSHVACLNQHNILPGLGSWLEPLDLQASAVCLYLVTAIFLILSNGRVHRMVATW